MSSVQPSVSPPPICDNCLKTPTQAKCGRCQLISYCSKECQTTAWKAHHRLICAPQGSASQVYTNPDSQGFSKVDYAALFQRPHSIPQKLHELFEKVLSKHGCTPNQFAALTAQPAQMTTAYLEGQPTPLTQDQYRGLTGHSFHPNVFMLPQEVIEFYQSPFKMCGSAIGLTSTKIVDKVVIDLHRTQPPQLKIAPEPPMQKGLKTSTDIKEGNIICRYEGQLTKHPINNHLGVLDNLKVPGTSYHLDQTRFSGVARFANEGTPNAILVEILEENLPPSFGLRAIRDIKAGEFIYWDYGSTHHQKHKKYHLSASNETILDQFCRTHLQTGQDYFKIERELSTREFYLLNYLISTPNVFFALHLNGALNPNTSLEYFSHPLVNQRLESMESCIYPIGRITALKNLAKIQDNQPLSQAVYAMRSTNALAFNIFCIMILDNETSPHDIPHYHAIADMFDNFYNYVNLDLQDRDEEVKGEQIEQYDYFPIIQQYAQIPASIRKKNYLDQLLKYLFCRGEGRTTKMEEIKVLNGLVEYLSVLKPGQITRPNINKLVETIKKQGE